MRFTPTLRASPHLWRIARVLRRHGVLGALRGRQHWPRPLQVREALEELGVVFLKFGQVLALRRDLLPEDYVAELESLHDRLPPMTYEQVRETVERELGGSVGSTFAFFDVNPLASATIAQVHAATLPDGSAVVVKVRRSGLEERIAKDTSALMLLASAAERAVPDLRALDLVGMVREFRATLGRETDFLLEAHTIQRFRAALARVEGVWIPDVVAQFSSRAVLTMEHSPGIRVDEYAASHPESRIKLAGSIAALVLNQVLDTGLFHADPHPGNVFVLGDGRICLHDFGMVGDLDAPLREALFETLDAVVRGDSRMLAAAYLELGLVGEDVDRSRLHDELAELLRQIRARPIQDVSVGDALVALLRVGSRHRVRNPAQVLLLARALLISEALMRTLDPDIDIIAVFRKEIERALKRRHSPSHLRDRGLRLALDLERVLEDAPHDLRLGLRRIGDGELGRVHAPKLEALGARASRGIERLTGAVAAAALIIAGALLATIGGWHRVVGDVLLVAGTAGTLLVALGALWKRDE